MKYVYLDTPCGTIKGIGKGDHSIYKGIRYATAGRWEAPEPVTSWEGVYDATCWGNSALQNDAFYDEPATSVDKFYADEPVEKIPMTFGEDCLFLNIWTPRQPEEGQADVGAGEGLPVLVYIHGGAYNTGSSTYPLYDGTAYARRGVVFVTINYRLNAFACACDESHGGNYGLCDQIAALQWIRDNIRAFGGDPARVTVSGESAGAMSVQNLLYAPATQGLMSGAIMMSGGGVMGKVFPVKAPEKARETWRAVCARFGAGSLDELADADPKSVFDAWRAAISGTPTGMFAATPVIDGEVIPDDPERLVEDGDIVDVPCLVGFLGEDMWPSLLHRAALDFAAAKSRLGMKPVYGYLIDREDPARGLRPYHGSDIGYAFGTLDENWHDYGEVDRRISDDLIASIASFAATGRPQAKVLPAWEPLNAGGRFMRFGDGERELVAPDEERLAQVTATGKPFPGM